MIKQDLINYREYAKDYMSLEHEYNDKAMKNKTNHEHQTAVVGNSLLNSRRRVLTEVVTFISWIEKTIGQKQSSTIKKLYVLKETEKTFTINKACDVLNYSKTSFHENLDKWIRKFNAETYPKQRVNVKDPEGNYYDC